MSDTRSQGKRLPGVSKEQRSGVLLSSPSHNREAPVIPAIPVIPMIPVIPVIPLIPVIPVLGNRF